MTKEEIILAISDDKMMPFIQPEQLAGIVDFVIKNYRPSLPSNLDEAAERILFEKYPQLHNGSFLTEREMMELIKDGAEWMAGQGASYNTKVGWIDSPTVLDWPDDILDKFEMGEQVIVQIRKNNPAKA